MKVKKCVLEEGRSTCYPAGLLARVGPFRAWSASLVRLLQPALGQPRIVGPVVALGLVETKSGALRLGLALGRVEVVARVLHILLDATG